VQAGRIARHDDHRDAARALGSGFPGAHGHGDPVGPHARGDEHLFAVDDPFVAVQPRRGAQAGHVGAAAGFGDGQRGDLIAAQHRRYHLLLQCADAMAQHRRQADVVREQAGQHTTAAAVARQRQDTALRSAYGAGVPPSASG
jgi:hypothetical protein